MACQCLQEFVPGPDTENNQCIVKCNNGECSKNFYCKEAYNGCVPQVRALHDACEMAEQNEKQCKPENSKCALIEKEECICNPDTSYELNAACHPKCTDNDNCDENFEFCETTSGRCEMKKHLGQQCQFVDECLINHSECNTTTNLCDCQDGFVNHLNSACYPRCEGNQDCAFAQLYCHKTNGFCVIKANLGQACDIGSIDQCAAANAICDQSTCKCDTDNGFVEDGPNTCVQACTDHGQCDTSSQYCDIDNGKCEMKKPLGQQCEIHEECSVPSGDAVCHAENKVCTCADDHYQQDGSCVKKCKQAFECSLLPDYYCHVDSGRCTPTVELGGICDPKYPSVCRNEDSTCRQDESSQNRCLCKSGLVQDGGICIESCVTKGCDPQDFCSAETEKCERKREFGEQCAGKEQCSDQNGDCLEERCSCGANFAPNDSNICVNVCTDSTTCESNQYCDKEGTSPICREKNGLGYSCKYADQCSGEHTECDDASDRCECSDDAYQYSNSCRLKCTIANDCLTSEYCNADNGQCAQKKPYGGSCSLPVQCLTPGADCIGNRCTCPPTHFLKDGVCVEKCTNENAVCDPDNQFCFLPTGECYLKSGFGERCSLIGENDECKGQLTTCLGSDRTCGCVPNADNVPDTDNCDCVDTHIEHEEECWKLADALGGTCEITKQCQHLGNYEEGLPAADCLETVCACTPESGDVEGRCYASKLVGSMCDADEDCTYGGIRGDVFCSSVCTCPEGEEAGEGGKACVPMQDTTTTDEPPVTTTTEPPVTTPTDEPPVTTTTEPPVTTPTDEPPVTTTTEPPVTTPTDEPPVTTTTEPPVTTPTDEPPVTTTTEPPVTTPTDETPTTPDGTTPDGTSTTTTDRTTTDVPPTTPDGTSTTTTDGTTPDGTSTTTTTDAPPVTTTPSKEPTISTTPSKEPTISTTPSKEPTITTTPSKEPTISTTPSKEPTISTTPSKEPIETTTPSSGAHVIFNILLLLITPFAFLAGN